MPAEPWGWRITAEELRSWIIEETTRWLVVAKPPFVVCHPSKHGPWSSLIGACRELVGCATLHMPFRLDRETSGVVVLAKDREMGGWMQNAVTHRLARKKYHAILVGEFDKNLDVDGAIGKHPRSPLVMRQAVVEGGSQARTLFVPLAAAAGHTLAEVIPETGRMHQIRVHAAYAGHPVLGDKIYGPGEEWFLEFVTRGLTPEMRAALGFDRQALHCSSAAFDPGGNWPEGLSFEAPLAGDLVEFARVEMEIDAAALIQRNREQVH